MILGARVFVFAALATASCASLAQRLVSGNGVRKDHARAVALVLSACAPGGAECRQASRLSAAGVCERCGKPLPPRFGATRNPWQG